MGMWDGDVYGDGEWGMGNEDGHGDEGWGWGGLEH